MDQSTKINSKQKITIIQRKINIINQIKIKIITINHTQIII